MTFVLTIENVKAAAKKAYDEKRLTAQNNGKCRYRQVIDGKVCVCAIGAAIEHLNVDFEKTRMTGDITITLNNTTIGKLIPYLEDVEITPGDLQKITHIQHTHDDWCSRQSAATEAEFLASIH